MARLGPSTSLLTPFLLTTQQRHKLLVMVQSLQRNPRVTKKDFERFVDLAFWARNVFSVMKALHSLNNMHTSYTTSLLKGGGSCRIISVMILIFHIPFISIGSRLVRRRNVQASRTCNLSVNKSSLKGIIALAMILLGSCHFTHISRLAQSGVRVRLYNRSIREQACSAQEGSETLHEGGAEGFEAPFEAPFKGLKPPFILGLETSSPWSPLHVIV